MSMPNSRLLVATTAGSRPDFRSSSTRARCSFDTEPWWELGWGTPQEYRAAGSPPGQHGAHPPRKMEVEDDSAVSFALGVLVRLHRHIDADLMVRRMSLTSKARFYRGEPLEFQSDGEFPLDHTTLAIGIHGIF